MKYITVILIILSSIGFGFKSIDIESGLAISGYNDVQIPRSSGTLISLYNELKPDPTVFIRGRFNYQINNKHFVSLLIAPLRIYSHGSVNRPVTFEGKTFPPNTQITSKYRFDSYRITYRYTLVQKENLRFGLGFTAKIRDAAISLQSDSLFSEKTNTGFVPIINFNLLWSLSNKIDFILDGDALGSPQGRAEDVFAGFMYNLGKNLDLKLGYRILEGGANVEEVNNFTLIHYASVGAIVKF
jgi:hypothetical protein